MKTVELKVDYDEWYAHAPRGGMRRRWYGGHYELKYKEHYKLGEYIDPHTERYFSLDDFIMDMINESIALLKEPCHIKLHIPKYTFSGNIIMKGVYRYWKSNNWCYKSGREADEHWKNYDKILSSMGHIVEVIE